MAQSASHRDAQKARERTRPALIIVMGVSGRFVAA
jgi:hypothetical protein